MENEENEEIEKNEKKYICNLCNYKCSYLCDWNRHITTRKHIISNKKEIEKNEENEKNEGAQKLNSFSCYCGKVYKSKSGLYKHNRTCYSNTENSKTKIELHDLVDLVKILVKENSDLKSMMVEQQSTMFEKVLDSQNKFFEQTNNVTIELVKNGVNNINNNSNNTNSHNKAFNLNFFLNETCKNAMNINDFIDSIKLQLTDLISVGELGYVEGISNIIVKNLKDLDVTERPIHCTDKKREVLYVKNENKWEKEDEEKKKIRNVIKKVANKNIRLLQKFKEAHPDCGKSASKYSDQYNKIIVESMGGSGDNDSEKEEKIIQKITKNITIDKDFGL